MPAPSDRNPLRHNPLRHFPIHSNEEQFIIVKSETTNVKTLPPPDPERLVLDEVAIDAARQSLDLGVVTS